jgi:hypothetical protein
VRSSWHVKQFAAYPGSTGGSLVGNGGLAIANFSGCRFSQKIIAASRRNQQAGRLRSPEILVQREEGLS